MTLSEVATKLSAKVILGQVENLTQTVATAAASDLMSDILTLPATPDLMLTGLATVQAIRTASVAGIRCVVIVRGKPATEEMIATATEENIILMTTELTLFRAAGLLYESGLDH